MESFCCLRNTPRGGRMMQHTRMRTSIICDSEGRGTPGASKRPWHRETNARGTRTMKAVAWPPGAPQARGAVQLEASQQSMVRRVSGVTTTTGGSLRCTAWTKKLHALGKATRCSHLGMRSPSSRRRRARRARVANRLSRAAHLELALAAEEDDPAGGARARQDSRRDVKHQRGETKCMLVGSQARERQPRRRRGRSRRGPHRARVGQGSGYSPKGVDDAREPAADGQQDADDELVVDLGLVHEDCTGSAGVARLNGRGLQHP